MGGYIEVRFAVVKGHVVCCVLERYKPAVDNLADVSKQAGVKRSWNGRSRRGVPYVIGISTYECKYRSSGGQFICFSACNA